MAVRRINRIVVHCTAGSERQSVWDLCQEFSHAKRWNAPGYHFVVTRSGVVVPLIPVSEVANGAKDYNANSIHVAWMGGVKPDGKTPVDNRTEEQRHALQFLVNELHHTYPNAFVCGHRDLPGVSKSCPCFDVSAEMGISNA